ncbi:hypothetical protein Q4Q35_07500 [Flavivirga aquimarina]|uniref:Trimeric autotransporter adhesin YadA-like head domain-containing protein n=1 Tax=Flavivirga aquimarina TaxID=2027862 RepID=A0ABT8W941_9FLAO|nr:hypothetical protein [Flavivirga aquimarina]MDO5969648.1 hypothetical protein [Flavivirga aquimarina]
MKKITLLIVLSIASFSAIAQAPDKMSYQAIVRNASDQILANQSVGMQISILQGSSSGSAVYVETQNPTTNDNGLLTIEIGTGTIVSGTFNSIGWGNNAYFIKTEIDPTGGSSYSITGTSQLMSVPYALHAKTADSFTETDPIFTGSEANNITSTDITNLSNLSGTNTGDQDISGIATNASDISDIETEQTTQNTAIALNTAKQTYPTADANKLANIEANATADQTDAEIKTAYENNADTNAFTDAEKTLLANQSGTNTGDQDISGIATNAGAITNLVTLNTAQTITGAKTFDANVIVKGLTIGNGTAGVATNTSIGINALVSNASGINNVAIGEQAGFSITGSNNVAIGTATNRNAAEGDGNIAIGQNANYQGTSGANNIALGTLSYRQGNSGSNNIALGLAALYEESTGSNNIALGNNSSRLNNDGEGNITIGYQAGNAITSGDYNLAIGYDADVSSGTLTNATAIGNGATVSASNKVQIGNSALTAVQLGTGSNVALETGTIKLNGGTPGDGKVLTSDASGNATWETPSSSSLSVKTISANTTLTSSDNIVIINGNYTATLPASPVDGQFIKVCSTTSTAGINGNGKTMYAFNATYSSVTFGSQFHETLSFIYSSTLDVWFMSY